MLTLNDAWLCHVTVYFTLRHGVYVATQCQNFILQIRIILIDGTVARNVVDLDFTIEEWFHLTWIFKDNTTSVYKDGCLYDTGTWMSGSGWDNGPGPHNKIYFGRFSDEENVRLDYEIDEVYIWEQGIPKPLLDLPFSTIIGQSNKLELSHAGVFTVDISQQTMMIDLCVTS